MAEIEPDVLIVEDDDDLRNALCQTLEGEGWSCHSVKNAWDAVAGIQEDGWRPRLILLDLMMPRMNGWEFLDARKRAEKLLRIPVVVLSAADEPRIRQLPADAILRKPINAGELVEMVRQFLTHEGGRQADP